MSAKMYFLQTVLSLNPDLPKLLYPYRQLSYEQKNSNSIVSCSLDYTVLSLFGSDLSRAFFSSGISYFYYLTQKIISSRQQKAAD